MKNLANNNCEFYKEFTAGYLERVATNAYIFFLTARQFNSSISQNLLYVSRSNFQGILRLQCHCSGGGGGGG